VSDKWIDAATLTTVLRAVAELKATQEAHAGHVFESSARLAT
jgi:hypothetical protein